MFCKKIEKEKIKTWFVTGASSGVGYRICIELLNRGYNVIAVSRRIPNIDHNNALCLSVDVTNPQSIAIAVKQGIEHFGRIDVLSNNAGISAAITLEEENINNMRSIMETNFLGTFNTIHALISHFRKNKNGTIINNTSMHGLSLRALGAAYCSSKYAVEGLTAVCWHETKSFCRVMAFELGVFSNTDVAKNAKIKKTEIEEYKNLNNFYKKILYTFNNDLNIAISAIIDQVEMKELPRRLILGKDAYLKVKYEIDYLKRDLRSSKTRALKCAKLRPDIIPVIIEKMKKILKKVIKNDR